MNKICPMMSTTVAGAYTGITPDTIFIDCLKEKCALWIKEILNPETLNVSIKAHCGLIKERR